MRPYVELTQSGKLRRLHSLAVEALARYDLRDPDIRYHCFDTNLLYRVTQRSGERYILRLASPGWRTLIDLQSEAMWLNALARDTEVVAPRVVRAMSGEFVVPMEMPGIPDVWNVTLMTWVPGQLLGRHLNANNLEKMGSLFAELHSHGASWQPPDGFTTRRFEHWLSRGEPNAIVNSDVMIDTGSRELINRTHEHVEAAYDALDRSDLRVIHCDLWHDNIKIRGGELSPFDFEDTIWGFRAHDIAMAMLDLLEDTDDERYPGLLSAFRAGYTAHMAWPDARIEPFQIGRMLWIVNWVARHQPQWLRESIAKHTPALKHYEDTGRVIKPIAAS